MLSPTPHEDEVLSHLKTTLLYLGIHMDEYLSAVKIADVSGKTTLVHLTCSGGGHGDGNLIVSAAHAAIEIELLKYAPLDIVINLEKPPEKIAHATITAFIECERQGVEDFATQCALNFVRGALLAVVHGYPWRQKKQMLASVDRRCALSLLYTHRGTPDALMAGNVDEILPCLSGLFDEALAEQLLKLVLRALGRPARTRLEVYETVYRCVRDGSTQSTVMHAAYGILFCHSA